LSNQKDNTRDPKMRKEYNAKYFSYTLFIVLMLYQIAFAANVSGDSFTLETVGNGKSEDVEWVRQQIEKAIGTTATIDPVTHKVTVGDGGNDLAKFLRDVVNSSKNVKIGVDNNTAGVVFGQWYQDRADKMQGLDVADLKTLPWGDANTVGFTIPSVLIHEIAQMYYGLLFDYNYDNAHFSALLKENLVYSTLGNKGRRSYIRDTEFEQLSGNKYYTFTLFSSNGTQSLVRGLVINSGSQISTPWYRDALGPSGLIVPYQELQWEGYTVPEPSTMLLIGLGLMGLAGVRRKRS